MCGIAGIVRYDAPGEVSETRVRAMQACLRHRGPDGQGLYVGSSVALAHTRLALIDPQGGAQPMTSPDGRYTIVYNGEVYNYRDLRHELRNEWSFQSDSDTEVVLAAYVVWGEQCLARLNGMFALFIWDERRREGFAARDLLGVKPLALKQNDKMLIFASEAKAIVTTEPYAPRPHVEALVEYFVAPYFSGVEHSMFDGVEYLQPGHAMRYSQAGMRIWQWGDYDLLQAAHSDEESLIAELRRRLVQAIERSLIADVPLGTFLSGGLDSTLITAVASSASSTELDTFTIRFEDQDRYDYQRSLIVKSDDTPFAVAAAKEIGVGNTIVPVQRADLLEDLCAVARINDALPAWEQEFAQHHLAKSAGAKYKGVLVGDAADETHYGYHFLLDEEATRSPTALLERFGTSPVRRDVLGDPITHLAAKYRRLAEEAGHRWGSPTDRILAITYLIIKRWLPRLLHNGDIHSMAFSLEGRVPMADVELLDLARRIDPQLAYRDGLEKRLLREAARGLMPDAPRRRLKSALPKDQSVAALYQQAAVEALDNSREFLGAFLVLGRIRSLCDPRRALDEFERSLLFRVIAVSHWQQAYGVGRP